MEKIIQGSPEWHKQRIGKVGGAGVSNVLAKIKNGEASARRDYRIQLACERLTGVKTESFVTSDMQRGIDLEPVARMAYEIRTGNLVDQCAFIDHPTISMSGASPDGLIGADGLLEIKVPKPSTHIDYMQAKKAPSKYLPQMYWQMASTGRKWVDFCSYCPDLPEELSLFIVRVPRDDAIIKSMEEEVIKFLKEVDDLVKELLNG